MIHYKRLRSRANRWIISDNTRRAVVTCDDDWSVVQQSLYADHVFRRNESGRLVKCRLPAPKLQHPDVLADKPFIFAILGFDKYHHTQFTGLNSTDTHGCYFWFANFNAEFQFTQKATMYSCQAPSLIKLNQILPRLYEHWEFIMKHGCLLWEESRLIKVYGMVSHHIGDMQDRDQFLRRRGTNKHSRCDGSLWTGQADGVKYPDNCSSLMQLGTIVPGCYQLMLWQHFQQLQQQEVIVSVPKKVGKLLSMTMSNTDIFNELPINSSLKSPLEINHTALLGFLVAAFEIEWTNMHMKHNFDQLQTRRIMSAYLDEF